jgi:thiamine-monophosphate kinase
MLDISDGLATDALHIVAASGVGLRVCLDDLPLRPATFAELSRGGADPYVAAATGGDDYELLLTLAPAGLDLARAAAREADSDATLTVVGEVADSNLTLLRNGAPLAGGLRGFSHG